MRPSRKAYGLCFIGANSISRFATEHGGQWTPRPIPIYNFLSNVEVNDEDTVKDNSELRVCTDEFVGCPHLDRLCWEEEVEVDGESVSAMIYLEVRQ